MRHGAGTQQLSQARVKTVLPKQDWHRRHEAIRGNQRQSEANRGLCSLCKIAAGATEVSTPRWSLGPSSL